MPSDLGFIITIAINTMPKMLLDEYVVDVLMPDLIGHDRRPSAFIVYLFLLRHSTHVRKDKIAVSLQTIATKTGLSKSSVQSAIRHLRRRQLLDPSIVATVTHPLRVVRRPWLERRGGPVRTRSAP
jgi:hypothetical protein